jgi:TfoX/Sxy family transcriptional regulator of competence genes
MAYDETLASRIRKVLAGRAGISEKKMFGGVAFLLEGKMFCGIVKEDLMLRVGPERHAEALSEPHVRPMDFTGRPMVGYVYIAPAGCRGDRALAKWVELSVQFVATLPAKKMKGKKKSATSAR